MDALLQPWVDALGPAAVPAGQDLVGRHAEPGRHYHDRTHLAELLQALRSLAGAVPLPVLLAAYAHDAVYDPTAADNEQRSADLARALLAQLDVPTEVVEEVVRLVLLTAGHDPDPGDAHGALLCDADLAVLAAPAARYREYADAVRQEYAHLDDATFRAGRAAVLRDLAGHAHLFTTPEARRRWEEPARRNLAAELDVLAAPPPAAG